MNTSTSIKNRLDLLFESKNERILSLYYTAGFPNPEDTIPVLEALQESGADIVEIGMPFSDPIADGPTIQESNKKALDQGMSIEKLFAQLKEMRNKVDLPVILMGYLNPVMQYGVEKFCASCQEVGIDGLILPDLPMAEYLDFYKPTFDQYGLYNIFLITPQTSDDRVKEIDRNSRGFMYMVSSASTTGAKNEITDVQRQYFERIKNMQLSIPRLIGFGISNKETFDQACAHANGAIIGSAFINLLDRSKDLKKDIREFINGIKN
ncbi:MAG TPA: tryptophan synthase subunit alpha [Cytophagales bacterium]|jgi:tryptophan synthase alpha chain|nr:tryptophan synthase subunit alpha [Cytophagales bacterium]